jgi:S1-C subfamily serine protease
LKYLTKAIYSLFCVTAVISIILLHSAFALSADISAPASFMDLESSVKELRDRIDKVFPSIVMIVVYDITGTESARGSGFFYDTDGRIITNASILKNAYSAEVISTNNRYNVVSVINYDESLDTAIIKVKALNELPLEIDFENNISTDEKVIAIGRTDNFGKTLSEGLVSSVKTIDESRIMIHGRTVAPLFSFPPSDSGPLLNSKGKVIGLTTYAISDNLAFQNKAITFSGNSINAISALSIKPLLDSHSSPAILQPKKSRVWWHWFKYKVKTAALSGFITLYTIGFTTIIMYIFLFVVVVSIIQFIFQHIKKKFF